MQVVGHPFVAPELAPDDATHADRLAASGKLGVVTRLLQKLKAAGRCALLLSQEAKVGQDR